MAERLAILSALHCRQAAATSTQDLDAFDMDTHDAVVAAIQNLFWLANACVHG